MQQLRSVQPSRHAACRGRRGFSALELTAAILIILILSITGMAGVRFIGIHDRTEQSARRLTHAFSTARSMAIANNSTYTVRIDMAHRNYWIDETTVGLQTIAAKVVRPELLEQGVVIDTFLYGTTVNTDPARVVRFFADGSSDDVTIMMCNETDDRGDASNFYTVRVYGPTGQCRVFEKQRLEPSVGTL
ncbi:MAG: GspH/FimT family protein [Candidatus Sumerlaeia bacterium]